MTTFFGILWKLSSFKECSIGELIYLVHRPARNAQLLGTIQTTGVNFNEYQTVRRGGFIQRIFKFTFSVNIKPQPAAEHFHQLVIAPRLNVVVGTINDHPLDGVAVIVEQENDGFVGDGAFQVTCQDLSTMI